MRTTEYLFQSFFLGGFECSTHRTRSGKRLDLIAATGHDTHARADYACLKEYGIRTVRDGIRWHLIEKSAGRYDFSSALPLIKAARETGTQVIWDLCHYGWPDDLDIFSPEFIRRFARLARAFARALADETDYVPYIVPVNEISFFSWAGATVGLFYPYATGRGPELKQQLVRAAIEAVEAFWSVTPEARILHTDPMINIVTDPARPEEREAAEGYNRAQFDGWDMLAGRLHPELGGHQKYLDIIGVNYYPHNQWFYPGG
ncbi:MAG TPA: beta-glucosidase, partial [Blastocatellia bacterium]|nr:beta-glucosidase [Blastocatellia bacterium]